jgi:LysR family cyn operon transcriptional activator
MPEPFEIRQLRYFLEVADAHSFSRAAQRLGVSQPAVSQQIRELENTLGTTLLQRKGKRISLTVAGQLFEARARAILLQVDQTVEDMTSEPRQLHGTLRLGVIPYLDIALMPKLLGHFAEAYPAIDLSVLEISSTDIETLLEEGRLDLGFGWLTRHSPSLHYEHLCNDHFTVAVSGRHPWVKRTAVKFAELHQQRIVQLPDTYAMRRITDRMFRNHRIRPRTVAEINSIEMLLRSLAPLNAVALMPQISLREAGHLGLTAIPLEGKDLGLEAGLLRLASLENPAVDAFAALTKAMLPKLMGERLAS